jgi:hypothetical protein
MRNKIDKTLPKNEKLLLREADIKKLSASTRKWSGIQSKYVDYKKIEYTTYHVGGQLQGMFSELIIRLHVLEKRKKTENLEIHYNLFLGEDI